MSRSMVVSEPVLSFGVLTVAGDAGSGLYGKVSSSFEKVSR